MSLLRQVLRLDVQIGERETLHDNFAVFCVGGFGCGGRGGLVLFVRGAAGVRRWNDIERMVDRWWWWEDGAVGCRCGWIQVGGFLEEGNYAIEEEKS